MFWRKANKQNEERRQKAEETFAKAQDYQARGETDAAITYAHAARDLYEAAKDTEGLGRAENFIGDLLASIGQFGFAEKAYERSAAAFKGPEGDAESLRELGEVSQLQGKREEALKAYGESLKLYKRLEDEKQVANVTRQIAFLLYEQEKWEEAEKYYRDVFRLAEVTGARDLKDSILLEIGNAIAMQGRLDEARGFFEQSARQARDTGDDDTLADALHSLAITYVQDGERQKAHELFHESVELNRASGDRMGVAYGLYEMGVNDAEMGDVEGGRKYIEEAATLYDELNAPEQKEIALATLARYL